MNAKTIEFGIPAVAFFCWIFVAAWYWGLRGVLKYWIDAERGKETLAVDDVHRLSFMAGFYVATQILWSCTLPFMAITFGVNFIDAKPMWEVFRQVVPAEIFLCVTLLVFGGYLMIIKMAKGYLKLDWGALFRPTSSTATPGK